MSRIKLTDEERVASDLKRKEYRKEYNKNYQKTDKYKEYRKEYNKNYQKTDKNKEYQKEYNKSKRKYISSNYYYKNKDKKIKYQIEYDKNRYNTDIDYKLTRNLRARLRLALKNQQVIRSQHTLDLLGCSLDFLKNHLQQTAITNGYDDFDINNYSGKEYHIDHIVPCSVFNLTCTYHQKLCFHYSNLQILSARDNSMKSNKILTKGDN